MSESVVRRMDVDPHVGTCDQVKAAALDALRAADTFILLVPEDVNGDSRAILRAVADIHFQCIAIATLEDAVMESAAAVGFDVEVPDAE